MAKVVPKEGAYPATLAKRLIPILLSFFVSVTVIWNQNPATDLAGYRLYSSTISGDYTFGEGNEIMSAGATETSKTITVGDEGQYYVLTAFDLSDNESAPSSEVFFDPPPEGVGQLTIVSSQ